MNCVYLNGNIRSNENIVSILFIISLVKLFSEMLFV